MSVYYQAAAWYAVFALMTYWLTGTEIVHWNRALTPEQREIHRWLAAAAWPYYLLNEILKEITGG